MPMGMLGNKSFTQVLLNDKGEATENPKKDPQAINPDQGFVDASSELVKAIEKKDGARISRCFKAMFKMCMDDYEMNEEEDETESMES